MVEPDYEDQVKRVENEWRELLIRFIVTGDQIFQELKNSDPTGFAWWMVRNFIIRQDPEIQIIIDKRTGKT